MKSFAFLKALIDTKQKKKKLMKHFSEEYLEQLINEHRLLSTALVTLQARSSEKVQNHGLDPFLAALNEIRVQRVIIEAKIDTIKEFLNS